MASFCYIVSMENTTQKYTLPQLADMVADCKNSMKPLLSKDDMDAVKSIMISASGLIHRHEFTQSKAQFSKDHPKVFRTLNRAVGKMLKVTDVKLRKEVGARRYDEARSPFYCQKVLYDPSMFAVVKLLGYFLYYDDKNKLHFEPEECMICIDALERGSWTVTVDSKNAKYIPECTKEYPPVGFAIRLR